ncbi:12735_t:CDS:1, partial [Funneliformis geosporum]
LIEICNTSITMDTMDNVMDTMEKCPLYMSIANTGSAEPDSRIYTRHAI